jgi:hypothetical protein
LRAAFAAEMVQEFATSPRCGLVQIPNHDTRVEGRNPRRLVDRSNAVHPTQQKAAADRGSDRV